MARVRVVEPMTGSPVEVDGDSKAAKQWQRAKGPIADEPARTAAPRKRAAAKK